MYQLELQHEDQKSDLQKPRSNTLSKNKSRMRKDIEERIGKRWREVEDDLNSRIQNMTERRHWLIRSSPQMLAVAEMILAQEKPMKIVRFLRMKDTQRFGANISDDALLRQVLRFKEEVVSALENEEGDDISMSRLDFYARLSGKHVDIHAMMTKLILFQESRLCMVLEKENECTHAWMRNKVDGKAEKRMQKAWKEGGKELDLYWKLLMSLALYEAMSGRMNQEEHAHLHQIIRTNREYFPRR